LLDTPGHKDFAEDTYRTLTAVDSVILVYRQCEWSRSATRRLMEVCRMRDTPVIVFVNKMDRDGKIVSICWKKLKRIKPAITSNGMAY